MTDTKSPNPPFERGQVWLTREGERFLVIDVGDPAGAAAVVVRHLERQSVETRLSSGRVWAHDRHPRDLVRLAPVLETRWLNTYPKADQMPSSWWSTRDSAQYHARGGRIAVASVDFEDGIPVEGTLRVFPCGAGS